MSSLPSWLCLLPSLASLYIDGNPFQGPWKALVEPLLTKAQVTPMYPPSTPIFPQLSASSIAETADMDFSDITESPVHDEVASKALSSANVMTKGIPADPVEDEHTITSASLNLNQRSESINDQGSPVLAAPRLSRTRTVPSQPNDFRSRMTPKVDIEPQHDTDKSNPLNRRTSTAGSSREVRRMRSADELRRVTQNEPSASQAASTSSTNISGSTPDTSDVSPQYSSHRFASLGASSRNGSRASHNRRTVSYSFWDESSLEEGDEAISKDSSPSKEPLKTKNETIVGDGMVPTEVIGFGAEHKEKLSSTGKVGDGIVSTEVAGTSLEDKEKNNSTRRWGFLKKMSMGKMRVTDSPSSRAQERPPALPISANNLSASGSASAPAIPQLLTTSQKDSSLLAPTSGGNKITTVNVSTSSRPPLTQSLSVDALGSQSSNGLLAPPTPNVKAIKRRSFLRLDGLPSSLAIPKSSSFLPDVTVADNDEIDDEMYHTAASSPIQPPSPRSLRRREQERIREAEARALRSVLAYLKDMNDLTIMHGSTVSMYASSTGSRSRRPTMGETMLQSEFMSPSIGPSPSSQLRSSDSLAGNRNTSSNATMSIATTDSSGSGSEERKPKYDKGKRSPVVREIIEFVISEPIYLYNLYKS